MKSHLPITPNCLGYCLVEVTLVLVLLGVCLAAGASFLSAGVVRHKARGAAQSWQAAGAWAQVEVLWQRGQARVEMGPGDFEVSHDLTQYGGDLGGAAPAVSVYTNVARWNTSVGTRVTFSGYLGSPDAGGSLYFRGARGVYRVVVRPESGLTARTWLER